MKENKTTMKRMKKRKGVAVIHLRKSPAVVERTQWLINQQINKVPKRIS